MTQLPTLRLAGESTLTVWARRAISFPAIVVAFALLWLMSPLLMVLALISDLVAWRTLPRTRALGFFLLYVTCEFAGLFAAWWLWLVARVTRQSAADFVEANFALQRWFTRTIFRGAVKCFSIVVEITGEAGVAPVLVFSRHASTADTVLAGALVATVTGPRLRYVLKRELLWDPCLDVVGRRLPNVFADRSGTRSESEINAVRNLANNLGSNDGVLIYPEGTRFSPKRLAAVLAKLHAPTTSETDEQRPARENLATIASNYTHVLPPKLGGPLALLQAAPGVDVVFLEHSGFEGARSFGEFFRGGLVRARLRIRLRRVSPPTESDIAQWLFAQWTEVNSWVAAGR
jgi:1-acyl-sn-glycerol-3-phosphate acyltransferase